MPKTHAELMQEGVSVLTTCQTDLEESASYYEATNRVETIGISTPEQMKHLRASIGWGRMYCDSIEERLDHEGFRLADNQESVSELLQWWQSNDLDEESGLAHLDALVYGRSYVTVSAPGPDDEDQDTPIIRVESPLNMYVTTDPRTRKVTSAVRLYTNPVNRAEKWGTLYLPNETVYLKQVNGQWAVDSENPTVTHNLGQVPVVPLLNRERLGDREGQSEITAEIRSFTDAASRTMMNMQAASELMAVPQRVLFGVGPEQLAPGGTKAEVLKAYMANILAVADTDGSAQQFSAAELRNFVDVLEELAKHVASYTGLPPQYLSFTTENPASAEAIRSAESRLVKKCERKARMFGGAWEEVMRLAVRIMKGSVPVEMRRLQSIWRDPSTPTYAAKADGVSKLYANGMGVIPKRRARVDIGYTEEEIDQMEEWDEDDKAELIKLADVLQAQQPNPTNDPSKGSVPSGNRPDSTKKAPAA